MGQRAKLADLLEESRTPRRQECPVASILGRLSEEDRATLLEALDNPDLYHTEITRALNSMGYQLHRHAVSYHRRRICPCP